MIILELPSILGIKRITLLFVEFQEKKCVPSILGTNEKSAIIYHKPSTGILNLDHRG